jgi:protein-serine/threonine kinase
MEREIDAFCMGNEQENYLRGFIRAYGRKEKKRPRDRLLRDKEVAKSVFEERKKGAFLGYSYRRIRKGSVGSMGLRAMAGVSNGKGKTSAVWGRGRISIF